MEPSCRIPSLLIRIPAALLLLAAVVAASRWYQWRIDTKRVEQRLPIPSVELADKALNRRVETLLRTLTLDEKIGQLTQYTGGVATGPGTGRENYDKEIARGRVGSLFNVVGAGETNRYQRLAVEKSPHHIPLLFGYDVIHGQRTIFPVPLALASSFDPALIEALSRMAAGEATDDGIRWVFSPMVDIARDARWGRITEGSGEDTFLGSVLAEAYVRGYQGRRLSDPASVAACVKHFAAYGAPNAGREYNTVDMSELTLRQVYLPPYHAGIKAGAATIMSAFNPLNGVPATANPFLLTTLLRNQWQFAGITVSDYGAVRELMNHGIATTPDIAARKALSSGIDMEMEGGLYGTRLARQVANGTLPRAAVDEAVRRVLRVKFALGLFDHPYADEKKPPYAATPQKREIVRKAAEESIVLLKNGGPPSDSPPLLPLAKETPTLALIGPLADAPTDMLGSWPAAGNPGDVVTLRAALQARCDATKTTLLYAQGTDTLTSSDQGFDAAVAAARKADVVIVALGESGATMTGESSSVTRLGLPGNQEALLETLAAQGKPVVLVLFNGRPLAVTWAAAHVAAIVEAWYPGIEAGTAVADILFGDVNPSAKLPVTFPRSVGQEPLFYNQLPTGRPANGIDLSRPPAGPNEKYLSRYIDEINAPLFPFGFGLSYTSFTYSNVKVDHSAISAQDLSLRTEGRTLSKSRQVHVTAEVRNAGTREGTEIVQLYLRTVGGAWRSPCGN
ncbi:beta-glucosidase [Verrucomicrobium sp. GAS474]|uniref:glycoside hydrolase family 3 N-terminal domain-containing protein n=1 Tax=Verrucomicrobium sp. GAS474 TaxID=1882831 RepID=UPI000879FCE3|nr:glycoside hydrolase family 3 N-terminal domain-containing protein [Verrucomicrobium sp. GAS474]SDU11977.1 beta-glucosidase [Verrucomicrobium sp. GAS474]